MRRTAPGHPGAVRLFIRALLTAVVAVAIVVVSSAPASASAIPGLAIDPSSGPPLATIKVTGAGFCPSPCSAVTIMIGTLIVENDVAVDAEGRFTTYVQVPDTTRPPQAPVIASQTDASGAPVQARRAFTVTVSAPPPTVYTPPTSIQPPGGVPLTTASASPTTSAPHGATTTTSGPTTHATSTTASTTPTSRVRAAPTSSNHRSGSGAGWAVAAGAAAVAAAAGAGAIWRRRRHAA